MKRNTFKYIVLVLLLAFVSRNEAFAQEVSRSTAKRVAETFLNQNARRGQGTPIQLEDITAETEFQNFYIFSADSGFVLVAADERVTPILGYSKTNRFVTEDMPDNLRCWLKGYDEQIQYAVDNQLPPSEKDVRQWNDLKTGQRGTMQTRITVGPLIETLWGQRGYTNGSSGDEIELYNLQCPKIAGAHCLPGCTAIALAQVMRYWRHPTYPHGTKPPYQPSDPQHPELYPRSVNFDTCSYDWSKMPIILSASTPQDTVDEVAQFIYQCAVSISSDFGVSGTDATLPSAASALTDYFYYKPALSHKRRFFYSNKKWKQMLKDDLSASPGRPVCYRGQYYDNENKRHGHAWVCDGYEEVGENDYFHFNFGWHGGSYSSGDPYNNYYSIDPINKFLILQYIDDQAAVFGIEPDEAAVSATVSPNVGGTVTGTGTYRKGNMCTLIATPSENYVFVNWAKNGEVISNDVEISFILTEDVSYVANFQKYICEINTEAFPVSGGTVSGGGTYLVGDQCTITATPNPGYIFKGWYLPAGLFPVNPLPTFTFTVTSDLHLIAKFQAVTPTTDVYQYYCWFDQDYSTVQTGSFQYQEMFFALDASALDEGIHTLHVMLEDEALSAPKTYLFLKTPAASSSSTYQYHCWFDDDYGTVQTGTFGGNGHCFALDANALDEGIHTLHVMLEGGDLSSAKTYLFLKTPDASSSSTYQYHCWFDNDYGTVQTGTFGGNGHCFALDANALDEGIHTLHVMLEGGELSSAKTYLFLKAPTASSSSTYQYHCWFDNDYGTVQTGTFGGNGYSFVLDASELDNGLHFLNVTLESEALSSPKRYLFYKTPLGGPAISRWEYCINGNWFDATVTDIVPPVTTLDILALLPVAPQPISSQNFKFEINEGQPEIYAKNSITFRFWDVDCRFIDHSTMYVDATVHETVEAEWIERNTTKTIVTPGPNQIHWFKLDANVGDLLEFKADHECTLQLFSPSGEQVFSSMNVASVVFNGSYAPENGIYYLAVHDVQGGSDNLDVTYRFTGATTQSVTLAQGWNWFSTYIEATNPVELLQMLETALCDDGLVIKSMDDFTTYEDGEWGAMGDLDDEGIVNEQMYAIQVSADCAVQLQGMLANPGAHAITLYPGWNWIGFPIDQVMSIEDALSDYEPEDGDVIKGMEDYSSYADGWGDTGDLEELTPGHGYKYYSNSTVPKILVFSADARKVVIHRGKHKE